MAGEIQPFISTVPGSLDGKGRICVPASFRHILASQDTAGIYLCPAIVEPALEAFCQIVMSRLQARVGQHDALFSPLHDDEAGHVFAETVLLPIDENGRVRVPDPMIATAQLKDKILFVGMNEKFQIWNPDIYTQIKLERFERLRAKRLAATAPLGGGTVQ